MILRPEDYTPELAEDEYLAVRSNAGRQIRIISPKPPDIGRPVEREVVCICTSEPWARYVVDALNLKHRTDLEIMSKTKDSL